jgi:hypothetical protein
MEPGMEMLYDFGIGQEYGEDEFDRLTKRALKKENKNQV